MSISHEEAETEIALQEDDFGYRSLINDVLDTLATGIIILDANFKVVWINQAIERYFRFPRDEIIGQDKRELIETKIKHIFENPEFFAKKILATYDNNTYTESFECHILPTPYRKERWLEYRSRPIETGICAGGRIEHYYGITQRKQAELLLETHARQQAALFHLSADLVATLDEVAICEKVVKSLHITLKYDHVALLLVDALTNERVVYASSREIPAELMGIRLKPGEGLSERPLLDNRPHYTPDVTKESNHIPGLPHGKSEVDVPLQIDGEVVGVLIIESVQLDAFTEDDFAVLSAVVNQTSVALARAREHRAVKEAEIRYETLLERVPVGLFRATSQGKFIDINPALVEMLAYPDQAALLNTTLFNLYADPAKRDQWQNLIDKNGLVRDFETQMRRYDDTVICVRMSTRAILGDDDSMLLYYEGSFEDVTARKQVEYEIQRRNQELSVLNRVIAASAATSETEVMLEIVCRELALAFNLPQASAALFCNDDKAVRVVAVYSVHHSPQLPDEPVSIENNPVAQHILAHKTYVAVTDIRTDSRMESIRYLERLQNTRAMLAVPFVIEGEVLGFMGVGHSEPRQFSDEEINLARSIADQTSGALARAQLGQERRRLSAAIEQTAESVIITDKNGAIVYVNPAFERVSGYTCVEVVGKNINLVKSHEHDDDFYRDMWTTINAGQVWHGQVVNKKKDGTFYTDEATITPVRNKSGEIINYVSVQRDVTQELHLQEQLRRSQRMKAVGQLTAGIAHDFNNLLTAINGFAELLQNQLSPDGVSHEMASKILQSGQHAAGLINQLLAFSRKQVITPQILNLNSVVVNVDRILQRVIGEEIELGIVLASNLGFVEVDPTQIEQVIINLAVNARDAMPGGGKLTIETSNVILDDAYVADHLGAQLGEHVLLALSDTGHGMSKEVQERIFEPFFTTKEVNEGTGLGLASVFGIVKQSKGNIWVYSEEGVGTTFKIYLPRAEEVDIDPLPPKFGELPRGSETILLVEDDLMVRDLATRILTGQGYTVLEATNGHEALQLTQKYAGDIDMLFTDVVMPQMGGKELADQLGMLLPKIKVLFASGYTDNTVVRQGLLTADVQFIQKPFTPADLAFKVREVLDN